MKFRKKPLTVDAEQYFHDREVRGVLWEANCKPPAAYVLTIHGQRAYLAEGDWVIAEPSPDRFYPCKPDIFAATYEPADSPAPAKNDAEAAKAMRERCAAEVEALLPERTIFPATKAILTTAARNIRALPLPVPR